MRGQLVALRFDALRRDLLRRVSERAVLWLIWLHGPLLYLGGRIATTSFLIGVVLWALAASADVVWPWQPTPSGRAAASAASVWALAALVILETTGQPWRTDTCLSFFALLGIAAALRDNRAIYVSAGLVAAHNIVVEYVLPPPGSLGPPNPLQPLMLLFEAIATTWMLRRATRAIVAAERAAGGERTPWFRVPRFWRQREHWRFAWHAPLAKE